MVKSFAKKKKQQKAIEWLEEELKKNKETYKNNIKLLDYKIKAMEAILKDYNRQRKKYDITKTMIDIELKDMTVINPLMAFHASKEWQDIFKKSKDFELESLEEDWELSQKEYKNKNDALDRQIDIDKIKKQQDRIEERNPEIISQLKDYGVEIKEDKKETKQDYMG